MAVIQNSTVLLSLEAKLNERAAAFKHGKKVLLLSRLRDDDGLILSRFPLKTREWLYLGSPVEAAPISEARYTTFYRHGFIRPSSC